MYLAHIIRNNLIRQSTYRIPALSYLRNKYEQNNYLNLTPHIPNITIKSNFSLQSTIESIIQTQAGIIKSISESTPVSYVQQFVVDVHSFTGLPWWASIIFTTVLLRTCITFPFAIHQNYIMAKIENLKLEIPDIVKNLKIETAYAVKKFGWTEQQTKTIYMRSMKKQWNALIVRDNCHPFKASMLLWIQLPMWVFLSISLRNLTFMMPKQDIDAAVTYTELTVGGFGWIPNLTLPDSSLILPIGLGLVNLLIIEVQSMTKLQKSTKMQRYATNLFRGVSLVMVPIAANVPSCMCVYWFTSSTCGLLHNLILLSPRFKRITKIPKTSIELENPYKHIYSKTKQKLRIEKPVS